MGDPMDRFFRPSPQRGRLVWAASAIALGTIVALLMLVTGVADAAEAVATVLVAPVFAVALYRGRTGGMAAAGGAAVVYAWARLALGDGAGMVGVMLLVLSRAGLYALTAYATPWVASRLPAVELAGLGRRSPAATAPFQMAMGPGEPFDPREARDMTLRARELDLHGWAEAAGGDTAAEGTVGAPVDQPEDDIPVGPLWEEPLDPNVMTPPGGHELAGEVAWDHPTEPEVVTGNGGDHGLGDDGPGEIHPGEIHPADLQPEAWEEPSAPVALSFPQSPAAPSTPTGWIDDATAPLGDETIPVGFTGELFLPHDLHEQLPSGGGSFDPALPPATSAEPPAPAYGELPDPRYEDPPRYGESPDPGYGEPPGYAETPVPEYGELQDPRYGDQPDPGYGDQPDVGYGEPPGYAQTPVPEYGQPLVPAYVESPEPGAPAGYMPRTSGSEGIDPETRLWNARFFRDRLAAERELVLRGGGCFSVVMLQVPDAPFQPLPYRRQVALLRELGHQFVQAGVVDHLVHLPDGAQHWFAVVLGGSDRGEAHLVERRLRAAIGGYLRNRGLQVAEIQSASLTSPDDDGTMAEIWASLLGSRV